MTGLPSLSKLESWYQLWSEGSTQNPPSGGRTTMGYGGEDLRTDSSLCLDADQGRWDELGPGMVHLWSSKLKIYIYIFIKETTFFKAFL
jgi:hypothetical protein